MNTFLALNFFLVATPESLVAPVLPAPLIHALGWTILHALWQGALIALLLALSLLFLRKQPAQVRYLAAVTAQVIVLFSALCTFFLIYEPAQGGSVSTEILFFEYTGALGTVDPVSRMSWKQGLTVFFDAHITLIVALWICGVVLFSLRLLGAWVYTRRLASVEVRPVSASWQARMEALTTAMHLRQVVRVLESRLIPTPVVIGHIKPVILLPVGMLTGLPPDQVEALLVHELAHIRRRDYLVNLLLSILETILFFHPAIWWISATIRREREYCCDEIAVAFTGNSIIYAKALAALQTAPSGSQILAMAATGKPKELLSRVRRILLHQPSNQSDIMEKTIATLLIIGSVFFFSMRAERVDAAEGYSATDHLALVTLDSLPKGRISIKKNENGKSIQADLVQGKIISLHIDGQKIAEADFDQYSEQISQLLEKLPTPPTPPTPPVFPGMESTDGFGAYPLMPPSVRFFLDEGGQDGNRREIRIEIDGEDTLKMDFDMDMSHLAGFPSDYTAKRKALTELLARLQMQMGEELDALSSEREMEAIEDVERNQEQADRNAREADRNAREAEKNLRELDLDIDISGAFEDGLEAAIEIARQATPNQLFESWPGMGGRALNPKQRIEQALIRDELIERGSFYKFELTDRVLKINGDKLPDTLRKKYARIYEEASGSELDSKSRVVIHTATE